MVMAASVQQSSQTRRRIERSYENRHQSCWLWHMRTTSPATSGPTNAEKHNAGSHIFRRLALHASNAFGSPWAFSVALATIVAWAALGPLFAFSDTWQLVINTSTTIVTFLMVFLIQHTQNRDTAALRVKVDEILRALDGARNWLINAEELEDDELQRLLNELQAAAKQRNVSDSCAAARDAESKIQDGPEVKAPDAA
jgi:low affinity Fe/Cu permease